MRYRCIHRRRSQYPVTMMCRVLQVSRGGYNAWRDRPESKRAETDREVTRVIRRVHADSKGVYGSRNIRLDLKDAGYHYGRHKVARLMRIAGLSGVPKRRFKVTTQSDPSHPVAKNLLKQDFKAEAMNQRWAADITYISTQQGWLYLAVVMDLYSRRIVGWSMSRRINRHLVIDALKMALDLRRPGGDLIHHSDRGSQYTSDDYQKILKTLGITCSMSHAGYCYDNAVMERFFWSLKHEWTNHCEFADLEEARLSVFKYVDTFYNTERIHQTLEYVSPNQFEENYQQTIAI